MKEAIKYANLGLALLLELCVLAAQIYWGFKTGHGLMVKIALGIGTPLLAVIVWGIFGAPKSSRQLHGWLRFILEFAFFGSAALALWASGRQLLAALFGILVIVNKVLVIVLKQQ